MMTPSYQVLWRHLRQRKRLSDSLDDLVIRTNDDATLYFFRNSKIADFLKSAISV